jgi:hypothetical protein
MRNKNYYKTMTPIIFPIFRSDSSLLSKDLSDVFKSETDKIEKVFNDLKKDLDTGFKLFTNVDAIFARSATTLHRTLWLCLGSALLATIGSIGAIACKRKYKKTRIAFTLLALVGAGLSFLSAYIMHKMHTSVIHLQPLVERRWNF